jgi:hypothetical protein
MESTDEDENEHFDEDSNGEEIETDENVDEIFEDDEVESSNSMSLDGVEVIAQICPEIAQNCLELPVALSRKSHNCPLICIAHRCNGLELPVESGWSRGNCPDLPRNCPELPRNA